MLHPPGQTPGHDLPPWAVKGRNIKESGVWRALHLGLQEEEEEGGKRLAVVGGQT